MQIFVTDPDKIEKHTSETIKYKFDFTNYLPTSATISSAVVTAYDVHTEASVTSVLSGSSTVTDSNLKVQQTLTAGKAGKTYLLQCVATLSTTELVCLVTKMYCSNGLE